MIADMHIFCRDLGVLIPRIAGGKIHIPFAEKLELIA